MRIAYNIVFAKVVVDVRSDDEDDDDAGVRDKDGEENEKTSKNKGETAKTSAVGKTSGIEDSKVKSSIKAANGHAVEAHDSFADAVIEGKKAR